MRIIKTAFILAALVIVALEVAGVAGHAQAPVVTSPASSASLAAPTLPAVQAPASSTGRGYTIPVVDLAAETARQVVVDREAGQYLGHPTTVLLEDGRTMIAVYPKGHGRGAIVMKRSRDGGRTWSERLPTPASWTSSLEVPTIFRTVDARGVKRLLLFSGLYPIRLSVSADDGMTWSELAPIGNFGGIVAMASMVALKTGRGHYMALFHDDGRFFEEPAHVMGAPAPSNPAPPGAQPVRAQPPAPAPAPPGAPPGPPPAGQASNFGQRAFKVYKTVSTDGGLTWSAPEVIAAHPEAHLCEPGIIRSPDGRQLAVLLRENSRKFNSFLITSDDEGKTWSAPRELPAALTGDRHVARYAPDGRLFITFRDTTLESATKGDWVGWVGRYEDIVRGREGAYRVRLMKNHQDADCAYPGLELLPDGTFVTTTYGHWTAGEQPYIVSVRFRIDELDRRRAELDRRPRKPRSALQFPEKLGEPVEAAFSTAPPLDRAEVDPLAAGNRDGEAETLAVVPVVEGSETIPA